MQHRDGLRKTAPRVEIDWRAPDELGFRGERQDLQEILGNLMENACKWAKRRVRISAGPTGLGQMVVVVEDDKGEIVSSLAALLTTHFERLWIDPAYRGNPGVVRSLIRELYGVPRARAEHWAFATAGEDNTRMESVCRRLGGRQMPPVKFYVMPLGD